MDPQIREDLSWWLDYLILHDGHSWQITHWDLVVKSHADSKLGSQLRGKKQGGPWTREERDHPINFLELLAAFLALMTFTAGL